MDSGLRSTLGINFSNQPGQHSFDLNNLCLHLLVRCSTKKPKTWGKQKVVLNLVCGCHSHLEKTLELGIPASATPLRYVGADGGGSAPNLRHNSEDFVLGEIRRHGVGGQGNFVRLLPNLQITKIFHRGVPFLKPIGPARGHRSTLWAMVVTFQACMKLFWLIADC